MKLMSAVLLLVSSVVAIIFLVQAITGLDGGSTGSLQVQEELRVEPTVLNIGDSVVIRNGLCNVSDAPVVVEFSLSILPLPASLTTPAVVLVDGEIPLSAGQCEGGAVDATVPDNIPGLTPGEYQLSLEAVVEDEEPVHLISNRFEVVQD